MNREKVQLKSQDELIGADGNFRNRKLRRVIDKNNKIPATPRSDDQNIQARDNSVGFPMPSSEFVDKFTKLNSEFSNRIKNLDGQKGNSDNVLNSNKKRTVKTQGNRDDNIAINLLIEYK